MRECDPLTLKALPQIPSRSPLLYLSSTLALLFPHPFFLLLRLNQAFVSASLPDRRDSGIARLLNHSICPSQCVMNENVVFQGHCFYHGEVQGMEGSSVAVSTCSGLREVSQNMKYVELLIVADKTEVRRQWGMYSYWVTLQPHWGGFYYKALNIRVALIGLEVWTSQDMSSVSDNPHSTLAAFLSWRQKQLRSLPNDNAQLVTGKSFRGTTIGLAPLKAMCSEYQSGGVNMDHSDLSVGVAATMAHEMGHNFGMSHDIPGCCQAKAEDGGCIMAAATGHPFPRVFNDCNMKELKSYLSSGGGKCLFNLPNTRTMYGGHRCGNEEVSGCFSGAECAHGVCCQNCKLKSPGVLCRAPSGSCDLPEFCDGKTESCPADFYLVDGTSCAGGKAYCYTGMCLTLEQQCRSLWGKDGRPAPDLCFKRVNEAGNMYGNCGKDESGNYRSCSDRNAKCGKIQCLASASKPIEQNAVVIETTVTEGYKRIMCKGTHVYKLDKEEKEPQGDTLDPGLVMTGTKCGEDLICFNGLCRNASFLRAGECNAKCHGHGLCNNNRNCHCDPGWAPPLCDQKGSGGSVDSGPVINQMWVIIAERLICAMTMTVTSHRHAFTASLLIACSKCLHSLMEEKKIS
uniref:ADAM metallopeptidase domain 19b n=1 Tax=Neolamprologus brichardi TaxID=32507 RepID=A0A3Q4MYT5_NEOBR